MKKASILYFFIATCFSVFAHAHVLHQPVGDTHEVHSQKAIKQPILYGNARVGGHTVPIMVIPVLDYPGVSRPTYLYAPMQLKRSYAYLLTGAQAKRLALYIAGSYGAFLAPRGMAVIQSVKDVDGSGDVILSDGKGDWVEFRTDGACAGCAQDSAFAWLPWVKSGFVSGETKPIVRYPMTYHRITPKLSVFSYSVHNHKVDVVTRYDKSSSFEQFFISMVKYPTAISTIIENFAVNHILATSIGR